MTEAETIIRRDTAGRCTYELHVDGSLFATGSAESVVDAAEIAAVIIADKIDSPAAWLASASED